MQQTQWMLEQRAGVDCARRAKDWLRGLPMTDPRAAHHAAMALLAEVADAGLAPLVRLEILETVRAHVADIDERYAPQYAGRPLPLGPAERNAFQHAQSLWRAAAAAYLEIFEASLQGAAGLDAHRALCLARAGDLFCAALKGNIRAGQAGADDLAHDLQSLVDLAAEHALLDSLVRDSLHPRGVTSVARIYRRAILIGLAGTAFSGRERDAMFELAALWEAKTAYTVLPCGAERELRREDLPPAGQGRQRLRVVRLGAWTHVVDVTHLSRSLRRRLRRLDSGETLEAMHLPDPFRQLPVRDLLTRAHRHWCEGGDARQAERGTALSQAVSVTHAGNDFAVMYCMVAGRPFEAGGVDDARSRRRHDELFVFQAASLARGEAHMREAERAFEDWEVVDEGGGGFRLRRPGPGARLRCGQLLALRLRVAGDGGPVVLARVRWLMEPRPQGRLLPGAVEAGVEIIAGKPHGVGIAGEAVARARETPAFRMGSLHGRERIVLVTPAGWYQDGRVVAMRDGGMMYRVRFETVVARGTDFEHIEATLLSG
jgi:hypothetical protein